MRVYFVEFCSTLNTHIIRYPERILRHTYSDACISTLQLGLAYT